MFAGEICCVSNERKGALQRQRPTTRPHNHTTTHAFFFFTNPRPTKPSQLSTYNHEGCCYCCGGGLYFDARGLLLHEFIGEFLVRSSPARVDARAGVHFGETMCSAEFLLAVPAVANDLDDLLLASVDLALGGLVG